MIELEKLPCPNYKKNGYRLRIITGILVYDDEIEEKFSERTSFIKDEDWSDLATLFFSYIDRQSSLKKLKWIDRSNSKDYYDQYHYGFNFKFGPIRDYINWFSDSIKMEWTSIKAVFIEHINNDGVIEEVKLPIIDDLFNTEEDFLTAIKEASNLEATKFLPNKNEDGRWLEFFEISDAKNILRNKFSDQTVDNLFLAK